MRTGRTVARPRWRQVFWASPCASDPLRRKASATRCATSSLRQHDRAAAAPQAGIEVKDCPRVDVTEGGAALRTYAGGRTGSPEALRSQLTISNVARECIGRPDGTIVVKVGVEGRALIGPAGAPGRFDAPIHVVVKRGERVFANRSAASRCPCRRARVTQRS